LEEILKYEKAKTTLEEHLKIVAQVRRGLSQAHFLTSIIRNRIGACHSQEERPLYTRVRWLLPMKEAAGEKSGLYLPTA